MNIDLVSFSYKLYMVTIILATIGTIAFYVIWFIKGFKFKKYIQENIMQVVKETKLPEFTVEVLRHRGYKVRVTHYRFYGNELMSRYLVELKRDMFGYEVAPLNVHGGATVVKVTSPEGKHAFGEAKCSMSDNYCRKTGVSVALKRAMEALND